MTSGKDVKEIVKEKYGQIAVQSGKRESCGCGCAPSSDVVEYTVFNDKYDDLQGYVAEADLGLGCGLPTEYAEIKKGDTVVDLGSGAGNDVFVARSLTGKTGKVIGIDMTPEMIEKARENNVKLGYQNVEFRLGEIEDLPLPDNSVDVVVSNCVLNLVPDKKRAFAEIHRILKPGAHFCISDIVIKGQLPERIRQSAEMYAGCVAGALQQDEYLTAIEIAGFSHIEIRKSKTIELPDELLSEYLSDKDIAEFRKSGIGILSVTVVGHKN